MSSSEIRRTRFAIVALQRTGTNMLGSILRKTNCIEMYGEVFFPDAGTGDPDADIRAGMFFPFFLERIKKNSKQILLTDRTVYRSIFVDFLNKIVDQSDHETVGIDIKYEQLDTFSHLPKILNFNNFKIIHLERKNRLARLVSHLVLNARVQSGEVDVHHNVTSIAPIVVSPDAAVEWIRADEDCDRTLARHFDNGGGNYCHIYYEDIVGSDRDAAIQSLFRFLGLSGMEVQQPSTVKQARSNLQAQIANFAELADALTEAGYGSFLAD